MTQRRATCKNSLCPVDVLASFQSGLLQLAIEVQNRASWQLGDTIVGHQAIDFFLDVVPLGIHLLSSDSVHPVHRVFYFHLLP